jgi:hypothetical protein
MTDNQSDNIEAELDRPKAILTEHDRELLLGRADGLSDRAREQRMIRLRRRVREALKDGALLTRLPPEERKLILRPRNDTDGRKVRGGASLLFRFIYMAAVDAGADIETFVENVTRDAERQMAEERGEHVYDPEGPRTSYHVREQYNVVVDEAIEKLQAGEPLESREVSAIWASDYELTDEELELLWEQEPVDNIFLDGYDAGLFDPLDVGGE